MEWNDTILRQQEKIRRSGETNMFDRERVIELARENEYDSLAEFVAEADGAEYIRMADAAAAEYRGEEL